MNAHTAVHIRCILKWSCLVKRGMENILIDSHRLSCRVIPFLCVLCTRAHGTYTVHVWLIENAVRTCSAGRRLHTFTPYRQHENNWIAFSRSFIHFVADGLCRIAAMSTIWLLPNGGRGEQTHRIAYMVACGRNTHVVLVYAVHKDWHRNKKKYVWQFVVTFPVVVGGTCTQTVSNVIWLPATHNWTSYRVVAVAGRIRC